MACVAVLALAAAGLAATARADGDPASDVLAYQTLFLPQDASVPTDQQAQLAALLQAAQRDGYALRVALIAFPTDLGSVTALWRQPQAYARFLGQELALVDHGPLLVVMPDGYGVYQAPGGLSAAQAAVAGLPPPGRDVGTATLGAIQRLAAAAGHRLTLPHPTAAAQPGSNEMLSWAVFAIGGGLILLAWIASLRAKPVPIRRHKAHAP
jgi:hypothetical protein